MDITFEMYFWLRNTPEAEAWKTVYPALFDLLEKQLSNLHSLRLTIKLPAWERAKELIDDEKFNDLLSPWERLARGRYWKRLQFSVPFDWEPVLRPRQEVQSIWKLEVTAWYEQLTFLECK